MKSRLKAMAVFIILTMFLSLGMAPTALAAESSSAETGAYLESLMKMAQDKYNYDITDEALTEGAVKGIFNSMDPYTEFFTTEEAQEFMEDVGGSYTGIGVVLTQMENYVVITRVFPSSPAETAGIISGDKVATINGKDVTGVSVDEVSSLIRGEEGTQVNLGLLREKTLHNITVERKGIKVNPINYEVRDGIAYISIDTFNSNTYDYWSDALSDIEKTGATRMILDLRNNTGGEVDQAISVARHLVPAGTISTLEFRNPDMEDTVYKSYLEKPTYTLVVLVNGMTASASEILAGAIQDTKVGTLVGTKTFGKARVQSVLPILSPTGYEKYGKNTGTINAYELKMSDRMKLSNEDLLGLVKITTGTYTTPTGRMIDETGLTPDETVPDPEAKNGVYINSVVKLSKTVKPGLNDEDIDVYNGEKILKLLGYDIDTPDMQLDSKTFAAIQQFQTQQGLSPYGVLDFSTQEALNQQYNKLLPELDPQYGEALKILQAK
ncbi:MAG TPA: S41 family peptidase [Syntrophomonas sp.]|nr:S41 family peptidase [Syntrophomonas sp.]